MYFIFSMSDVFFFFFFSTYLFLFVHYVSVCCCSFSSDLNKQKSTTQSHDFHLVNRHEHVSVYRLHPPLWITGSHCFFFLIYIYWQDVLNVSVNMHVNQCCSCLELPVWLPSVSL